MKQKEKYNVPILSEDLENRIEDAIQAYAKRGLWKKWGLDRVREQGHAILLYGPPGTGKTLTAYHIGKKLRLQVTNVSMADYGSDEPGELARNIKKIFEGEQTLARLEKRHLPIILLDECDAMLMNRDKLGPDMVWLLEPINALLVQIGTYPGLVILATNMVHMLDEALDRRLIAKIRFERPDEGLRYQIWRAKWPLKFPVLPSREEYEKLAKFDLSGAQIENVFLLWAGRCIREGLEKAEFIKVVDLINFIENEFLHLK
jgi:SpoVK/Ycf46/Vps4 family AAA+-type ATPase